MFNSLITQSLKEHFFIIIYYSDIGFKVATLMNLNLSCKSAPALQPLGILLNPQFVQAGHINEALDNIFGISVKESC